MKSAWRSLVFCSLILPVPTHIWADEAIFRIAPTTLSKTTIQILGSKVLIKTVTNGKETVQTVDMETEKQIHLEIGDFNSDKMLDLNFWHIDDGMGTYTVHRIFIYSQLKGGFYEIHPSCGDEFLNFKFDAKRSVLQSTYYVNNLPKTCRTKLKMGH